MNTLTHSPYLGFAGQGRESLDGKIGYDIIKLAD